MDVMKDTYDKVYQAECAKMGIITTAQYAGISRLGIKHNINIFNNPHFNYFQTGDKVVFIFIKNESIQPGKLEIFHPNGKLLKTLTTNRSENRISWDGTNNSGTKITAHSVIVVKYSTPVKSFSFKTVMR
jgi:hypothetical protein